jgi:hypothetical protein
MSVALMRLIFDILRSGIRPGKGARKSGSPITAMGLIGLNMSCRSMFIKAHKP